jgi:N-acetyltransferase
MTGKLDVFLAGTVARLEPLSREHGPALFAAAQFEEIWEWWPFDPSASAARFEMWLDDCLAAAAAGTRQHYATIAASIDEPIGSTSFCTLRPEHRGIEIGWTWLTPSVWRSSVNAEAKFLMLAYAFDELECQRVEFETDERNARSRRALLALPARFEGVRRDDKLVRDGEVRSSAYYSVLASEWPEVRANLKRRIATRAATIASQRSS